MNDSWFFNFVHTTCAFGCTQVLRQEQGIEQILLDANYVYEKIEWQDWEINQNWFHVPDFGWANIIWNPFSDNVNIILSKWNNIIAAMLWGAFRATDVWACHQRIIVSKLLHTPMEHEEAVYLQPVQNVWLIDKFLRVWAVARYHYYTKILHYVQYLHKKHNVNSDTSISTHILLIPQTRGSKRLQEVTST